MGLELGQGAYGMVKISTRRCYATHQIELNNLLQKQNRKNNFTYAIKQIIIPEGQNCLSQEQFEDEMSELI